MRAQRDTFLVLALGCSLCFQISPASAQQPETRAEILRAQQIRKSELLAPEERTAVDRAITKGTTMVMENLTYGVGGLGMRFGGLPTGQGFALGPQYTRYGLADGRLVVRASAAGSVTGAYLIDSQLTAPRLFGRKAFVDLVGAFGNYPRIDYYGRGPDSNRGSRTHFRLEESRFDLAAGIGPLRNFHAGITGGHLGVNVGPGNRDDVSPAEDFHTELTAPGLHQQTDFLRGGLFARYDYRDDPIGARSGGMYLARLNAYNDFRLNRFDFRTLDLEVRQYFPLFNRRRVIALSGAATFSYSNGTSRVPVYLQPTLGGSEDLRGFRAYRFYDDNMITASVEYRWEVFSGLDLALFCDAGKVAPKRSQINFHNLETSAGFGFRFNARNRNFLRIDTGFSHEGIQVWLKFGVPLPVRTRETAISGKR